MADFITMTCKSCGGKLQITPEIDDFACMYCGTEFRVKREGGTVALTPLVDEIRKVSVSTDKTASELAIIRLKEEINDINTAINIEKDQIESSEERLNNVKRRYDFLLLKFEENQKKASQEIIVRKIITLAVISSIIFLFSFYIMSDILKQYIVLKIAIFSILTIIIYLFITWWNPSDYLQKNRIYSNEKQLKRIKSHEEKTKNDLNDKLEVQRILESKLIFKEQELENHKKIVGG